MRRKVMNNRVDNLTTFADPKAVARLNALIRRRFPEMGKAERIRKAQKALKALWRIPIRLSKESIDRIANAPYYNDR